MNYYEQMQKAINYIEDHLYEKIELTKLSSVTGYSVAQFYRIFGAMIGCSVMEYVRKRRLSDAQLDLKTSDMTILEIALKNGYDSHEGFTRVFKNTYGLSPSQFRNSKSESILYERFNLLSIKSKKGKLMMKPEIIIKEAIKLVGAKQYVEGPVEEKFRLFRETREKLMSFEGEIQNKVNDKYIVTYDLDIEELVKSHDEMKYTYYYCVEVSDDKIIPESLVSKELEPAKYAVFRYDRVNKTLNKEKIDRQAYDYINGIWLPESGYELTDQPDFELVDLKNQTVDYYISIK